MKQEIKTVKNENLRRLLEAATRMYGEYDFLIPPNFEKFDDLSKQYEQKIKKFMLEGRAKVLRNNTTEAMIGEELYRAFINQ